MKSGSFPKCQFGGICHEASCVNSSDHCRRSSDSRTPSCSRLHTQSRPRTACRVRQSPLHCGYYAGLCNSPPLSDSNGVRALRLRVLGSGRSNGCRGRDWFQVKSRQYAGLTIGSTRTAAPRFSLDASSASNVGFAANARFRQRSVIRVVRLFSLLENAKRNQTKIETP